MVIAVLIPAAAGTSSAARGAGPIVRAMVRPDLTDEVSVDLWRSSLPNQRIAEQLQAEAFAR